MRFKNNIVIVTGASKGIGRAIALAFASEGARLAVCSRQQEELTALTKELGRGVFAQTCDATSENQVTDFLKGVAERFGTVDVLVNNVGMAVSCPLIKMTTDFWQKIIDTNMTSVFYFCRAVAPAMMEKEHGAIVNVASIVGKRGGKYISAYSATKHAVLGFTRSLAEELKDYQIRINAVCPGYVDTPTTRENIKMIMQKTGKTEKEVLKFMASENLSGRIIKPEEVAEKVLELASDDSVANGEAIDIW